MKDLTSFGKVGRENAFIFIWVNNLCPFLHTSKQLYRKEAVNPFRIVPVIVRARHPSVGIRRLVYGITGILGKGAQINGNRRFGIVLRSEELQG